MHKKYELEVFVAGIAPDTQTLIVDLKDRLTDSLGDDAYNLKVVDVLEAPELAEREHILATPTVVRTEPTPIKKIILNPNNEDKNLIDLGVIINE